jgi:hypothetical protein
MGNQTETNHDTRAPSHSVANGIVQNEGWRLQRIALN